MNVVDSPPGMTRPSRPVELLGLAHLDRLGAEAAQHLRVLAEVPLHGENADPKRLHALNGSGSAVALTSRGCSIADPGNSEPRRRQQPMRRGDRDRVPARARGAPRRSRSPPASSASPRSPGRTRRTSPAATDRTARPDSTRPCPWREHNPSDIQRRHRSRRRGDCNEGREHRSQGNSAHPGVVPDPERHRTSGPAIAGPGCDLETPSSYGPKKANVFERRVAFCAALP